MVRCTIGRVFTLVLVAIAFILTATLLSDFHHTVVHHPTAQKRKQQRYNVHVKSLLQLERPLGTEILNQSVVDQVGTFLMFIGYPRSGHSIVASCLDAHPDAIVAHEFNLLARLMQPGSHNSLQSLRNRTVLFSSLCQNSLRHSLFGWRSPEQTLDKKGYTLGLNSNSSWQGRFRRLRVIGDKAGGLTTHGYRDAPASFISAYQELSEIVQLPIKFLHVVRNPYDIIATKLLYRLSERRGKKGNFSAQNPIRNERQVMQAVRSLEAEAMAVQESTEKLKLVTLEVHNVDFIRDTKKTMTRICQFLGLECTKRYLQLCDDAAYDQPSKSRDSVAWTKGIQQYIDQLIQDYPFFSRYSFSEI